MAKRVVSPEASGDIGGGYESQVAACYLASLLAGGITPGLRDAVCVEVAFQQGPRRPLDDIVISARSGDGGERRLDLQIKHSLTVSAGTSNADFRRIVADTWRTIQLPDFQHGLDRAGAASADVTSEAVRACRKISDIARQSIDAAAFASALAMPGQLGRAASKAEAAVRALLGVHLKHAANDDELHAFWRHFTLLRVETEGDYTPDRTTAVERIAAAGVTGGRTPAEVLAALTTLAAELKPRAAKVDRSAIIELLRSNGIGITLSAPVLATVARSARRAVRKLIEGWGPQDRGTAILPEFVMGGVGVEGVPPTLLDIAAVTALIEEQRRITVVGEPGAGKSMALVQLAASILESEGGPVPILCSLPAAAAAGVGILDFVAQRTAFLDVPRTELARLVDADLVVLLLDGWNELAADQRSKALADISALTRDSPGLRIFVTTRAGTSSPLPSGPRLQVRPFDRRRQELAAVAQMGEAGREVFVRARAVPALRPLMATPILLRSIIARGAQGKLPRGREAAIAGLVETSVGDDLRAERLRSSLRGNHVALLDALAWRMSELEVTWLSREEAIRTFAPMLISLARDGLIAQTPAVDALELLLSIHLLVADEDGPGSDVRFQHQLIQEWFASHLLDQILLATACEPGRNRLDRLIDRPSWSVAFQLSADRLSTEPAAATALGVLIVRTTGIAPILAAEIARSAGEGAWATIAPEVVAFARRWSKLDPDRAAFFMLVSGRPEFAYDMWAMARDKAEIVMSLMRQSQGVTFEGLHPTWRENFPSLPNETRRVLVADLIEEGTAEALALAVESATADADEGVIATAVDYLSFRGELSHLAALLDDLPEPMWEKLVRVRAPEELSVEHAERWQAARRSRLVTATGPEWVSLALEFDAAPPDQIVAAAFDLMGEHWVKSPLQDAVREAHPDAFARELAARILDGRSLPWGIDERIPDLQPGDLALYLAKALDPTTDDHYRSLSARMLDAEAVNDLVCRVVDDAAPGPRHDWSERLVYDALAHVQFRHLARSLSSIKVARAAQGIAAASMLADWRGASEERSRLPDTGFYAGLVARCAEWSAVVVRDVDGPRYGLAEVARAMARLADPSLATAATALWHENRRRHSGQRRQARERPELAGQGEAHMEYGYSYRNAFAAIGGDALVDTLLGSLGNPDLEEDAAFSLARMRRIKHEREDEDHFATSRAASDRREAHAALANAPADCVADALLEAADLLRVTGDETERNRALRLATAATGMHFGIRASIFDDLLRSEGASRPVLDLCEALAAEGQTLPSDVIRSRLKQARQGLEGRSWVTENDYWEVKAWMRLAMSSDDPDAALPRLEELPRATTRQHELHTLVGWTRMSRAPSAVTVLKRMLEFEPSLSDDQSVLTCLAQMDTAPARKLLLDVVARSSARLLVGGGLLGSEVAAALEGQGEFRGLAFARIATIRGTPGAGRIAELLAARMDENVALELFEHVGRDQADPVGAAMLRGLDCVATHHKPLQGTNAYEIEAASVPHLRRVLFASHLAGDDRSRWSGRMLIAIDHLRDQHGQPIEEGYHPNIREVAAWPDLAAA